MKKFLSIALCFSLLLCATVVYASSTDLASMSQDELHALIDQARLELLKYEVYTEGDKVVFDHDGLKATLKGVEYDRDTIKLSFVFENGSNKSSGIIMDNAYVNGWLAPNGSLSPIDPGKKAKGTISIYKASELEVSSLKDLNDLEFTMYSFDASTFQTDFVADAVRIDFDFQ